MNRIALTTPMLLGFLIVTFGMGTSNVANAQGTAILPTDQPVVEITKTCPGLRYLGRNATFEINVVNRGGGAAKNVVVTDTFTGGLDFISADNGGARQGSSVVWRIGALKSGKSRTLKATFRCNRIGVVKNSATVAYCAEDQDACEFPVKGIPAILLECVDDPDPIEINSGLTYTISVTNQGTAIGTNIVIDCTLPAQEEHVASNGPTKAVVAGKKVTFTPLAKLAPHATVVYKVKVKGVGVGDVRFRVEMTSDQVDSPVMETESTHIYE